MMRLFILAASAVSMSVTALASATSIGKLTLSGDDTLEVTDKTYLYLLDATADATLTVTGGGDLYVSRILSSKVNFKLVSGRVFVGGELQTPAALTHAQFRLDASKADSLTTETVDDVSYVNTWADANGSNIMATAGTSKPYLTTEAGRTWVDFGSLKSASLEGYGGNMTVPTLTAIREAYVVARPDDSVKPANVRTGVLTASGEWYVFLPGSNDPNVYPYVVWHWNGTGKPAGYLMDGIYQDGVKQAQGGRWTAGAHVYDLQVEDGASDDVCKVSTLCNCTVGGTGGFRVGEIVTFTAHLSAADREVINGYLNAKWMSDYAKPAVGCFDIGKGTSVRIWNGSGWDTYCYKEQTATLNLTEDTTVNVDAGEELEVYELKSNGAHKLTKTGSGVLKIGFVDSSEVVIAVNGGEVVFDDPCLPMGTMQQDAVVWLDAEASDTLTTSGGQVTKWTCVNGATAEATAGTTAPVLSTENGRTIVDFGACDITAPASMELPWIGGVREAFAVAKADPSVRTSTKRVSVFGKDGWTSFQAGFNYVGYDCQMFNYWQTGSYTYQLNGGLSINGASVGNDTCWRSTLCCYGFKLAEPTGTDYAEISTLCGATIKDGFSKGGFKVGEVIVFQKQLTDANRALVNAYLRAKWLSAKRYRIGKVESSSGGSVKVLNGGTLEIVELAAAGTLGWSCGNGTISVNPLGRPSQLHLDADDADSLVTSESEGKTLVTRWNDTDGGAVYASAPGTVPCLATENGRKMVDFGPCGIASPAYMGLNATLTGVREALLVAKGDATVNTAGQRVSVFGTDKYSAFTAGFFQGNYCEIFNLYQIPKSTDHYTYQLDGGLSIDGVSVSNGTGWRTKLACYGFRLTDPEAGGTDWAKISSLCNSFGKGGFKVGEVLVFTNQLSAASRALVNTCLKAKWLGNDGYGCSFGTVFVDVGGTVAVPYAVVSAATLRIGGTFTAQRVAAQEIVPLAVGAAVEGVIDLTTPGTVRVDSSVFGSHEDEFRILSADGVIGSAKGWTLTGDYAAGFKLKARADGLYAVPLSGMVLLIR